MQVYNPGLDALRDWQTATAGTFAAMLLKGGFFVRDSEFVDDLFPSFNEVTVAGYARLDLTTLTRTVNLTDDQIEYAADRPNFGTMAAGEDVTALVIYRRAVATVDTDATSLLIGYQALSGTPDSGSVDPFIVVLAGDIPFIVRAASGS